MPEDSAVATEDWQRAFLREEQLPGSYLLTAQRFFDPLANLIDRQCRTRTGPLFVAINGSQGSGKSTLGAYLVAALFQQHQLQAVALSLDDFYLPRAARQQLAAEVHPLLATRGVPGTHDVPLLRDTLDALKGTDGAPAVPTFSKAMDDRLARAQWPRCQLPLDVVLLEGWCVGARAEPTAMLVQPINALEREEDPAGTWRGYVNRALAEDFEPLYPVFDLWVMLAAPSFEQVLAWRTEQEDKLRARVGGEGYGLMDGPALSRFVAHFERQTRNCLAQLPSAVDVLYTLDAARNIAGCRGLSL